MKPSRNHLCPCGSLKKYKHCCERKIETRPTLPMTELNKLNGLFNVKKFSEMETHAILLLEHFPDEPAVWNLLASSLQMQGKDALAALKKTAELLPCNALVQINLADAFSSLGQHDEAVPIYRYALEIKPNFAEAHHGLGLALKKLGQIDNAVMCYRRALEIKPDFTEAKGNLGISLRLLGQLDEAESIYRHLLKLHPESAQTHLVLGNTLCDLDKQEQAAIEYQKALDLDPENYGLEAAIHLATLHYLDENFEECRSKLFESRLVNNNVALNKNGAGVYWRYLNSLLSWHHKFSQKHKSTQDMEIMYVIGESHSLTAHGIVVCYDGNKLRCKAEWIAGCKQWHLGNRKENNYKYKFESIMARLPSNSTVLICIGEIDCRYNEGILKVWKKYPDKALTEITQSTIVAYVNYVATIGARYGHKMILEGVPAPNVSLNMLNVSTIEQLTNLIRIFNSTLKLQAISAGMDFLDVYDLTHCRDGTANGKWHIDEYHLLPSAIVESFSRLLPLKYGVQ